MRNNPPQNGERPRSKLDEVQAHLADYLRAKGIDPAHNFHCLNQSAHPTGDRNPSMGYYEPPGGGWPQCHCFACDAVYHLTDLIAMDYHITDRQAQIDKACSVLGLCGQDKTGETPPAAPGAGAARTRPAGTSGAGGAGKGKPSPVDDGEIALDLTAPVEAAHAALMANPEALAHYTARGLSLELIQRYRLGYDPAGLDHMLEAAPDYQSGSRTIGLYKYILPYPGSDGRYHYISGEICDRSRVDKYTPKYRKPTTGRDGAPRLNAPCYNERYIETGDGREPESVVFVVEGIYDALSVEEAGGKALALVGVAHERFIRLCNRYRPHTCFVLALDNDGAGQTAQGKIKAGLDALGIPYIERPAPEGSKDYNEALTTDREALQEWIAQAIQEAEARRREKYGPDALEAHELESTRAQLPALREYIHASNRPAISTGWPELDRILDGGLYRGVYYIGAMSALGKTTYCLQLMDAIAAQGIDTMIYALEMPRYDLMAKSISRHTMLESLAAYGNRSYGKSARGILDGRRYNGYDMPDGQQYEGYTDNEQEIIDKAVRAYAAYTDHSYIYEGTMDIGVAQIRETVQHHIDLTGRKPVLLIDYLQILAPANEHYTDKQNTDWAVKELARLSRDLDLTILVISSLNRENYNNPVSMTSFKESGGIEYGGDVVIGLQYAGMDYAGTETPGGKGDNRAKRLERLRNDREERNRHNRPIYVQAKVIKSRLSPALDSLYYAYWGRYNYFEPVTDPALVSMLDDGDPEHFPAERDETTSEARAVDGALWDGMPDSWPEGNGNGKIIRL